MPSSDKNGLAEAERRIAEAKRRGETALNLSDLGLEVLPESVCRLAHLRFLHLDNNRLTQLPEKIGRLARLKRLHLNSNQLARLPESIGRLAHLEELYLHRNLLTQLPESIRQLARLRKLCLDGNEALNIPAEELGPPRGETREKTGSRKPPHEILDYYFRTRIARKSERGEDKTPGRAGTPRPLKRGGERIRTNRTKICFVVVHFGKWPVWFPAFLHSCKNNPTINWIFFTDCGAPAHHSPNTAFHSKTMSQMRELIKKKIDEEAKLEGGGYKICDYKPAFGILFDNYLSDFDFWGHCDIDIIWGDIRKYATEEILDKYDIFSTRKGRISGHFSLFRNTPSINQLFRQSSEFAEVMRRRECRGFDEEGMTRLIARLARTGSIRVYWPKFLQNYADPKTDAPSKLPRCMNKYFWEEGRLFDCTGQSAAEILYLHFMTWKKTLTSCAFGYGAAPEKFYISYSGISLQPVSPPGGS
jgi:Leucine rich repeat